MSGHFSPRDPTGARHLQWQRCSPQGPLWGRTFPKGVPPGKCLLLVVAFLTLEAEGPRERRWREGDVGGRHGVERLAQRSSSRVQLDGTDPRPLVGVKAVDQSVERRDRL